jgi:hypothetical protein
MIKLEPGTSVHIGGRKFVGEIPSDICPESLRTRPADVKNAAEPTAGRSAKAEK